MNEAVSPGNRCPAPPGYERAKWILLLAYLAILAAGACVPPLQEPDEARCASISWEMHRSGDWITPHLNSVRYYEKPPLFFWLEAMVLGLFGPSNLAFRIPSLLASFLTVMLVVHWGKRLGGARAGLLAGAIQASMLLFSLIARVALVDPLLTLCIAASLYCAFRFLEVPDPSSGWPYGFWSALAAAALVKGPVGIVLPLAALVSFQLWSRDSKGWRMLLHPGGLASFFVITMPWYASMTLRNPGYLREFLLGQNLDRLVEGSRFNRNKPIWYYVPVLLVGLIPWTLFLPHLFRNVVRAYKDRTLEGGRWRVFLATAVLVPFVILSLAHSKLPHYLLPLTPPLSLLLGEVLRAEWERPALPGEQGRSGVFPLVLLGAMLVVVALLGLLPIGKDAESISRRLRMESQGMGHETDLIRIRTYQMPLPGAVAIAGVMGVFCLGAAWMVRRNRPWPAALGLSAAFCLGAFGAQFLVASMGPSITSQALAQKVARNLKEATPVVLYRRYLRGLTYYLGRPVVLWETLYSEFGHELSPEESARVSLEGKTEVLTSFLARHPDSIVIVESPMRLQELETVTRRTFDELDQEREFFIVRVHPSR